LRQTDAAEEFPGPVRVFLGVPPTIYPGWMWERNHDPTIPLHRPEVFRFHPEGSGRVFSKQDDHTAPRQVESGGHAPRFRKRESITLSAFSRKFREHVCGSESFVEFIEADVQEAS